jgi:hypothetical protein
MFSVFEIPAMRLQRIYAELIRGIRAWNTLKELNSVALVRKRIIPTERPPLAGEVSANLCG